jgi:peptidoglycan/xylan/chitin deacetylase (PgdA/CDA1 family)
MIAEAVLKRLLPRSKRGIVFAGHGVAREWRDRWVEQVHIPFGDFAEVVSLLQRLDFDFLGMDDVVRLAHSGQWHPKHWTHLTFDDGYQNNFDTIYPFLKQRRIPFSVFVSTHHVASGDRFPTFWLRLAEALELPLEQAVNGSSEPLSAQTMFEQHLHHAPFRRHEQIIAKVQALFSDEQRGRLDEFYNDQPIGLADLKQMAADPLVHIGSHSHHHIIFHEAQDEIAVRSNVKQSLRLLNEEWRISDHPTFCYPNGDWAPQWVEVTRELGIPLAFANATGFVEPSVEPMLMPRFWLSTPRRALMTCALSLVGNKGLHAFGRKPPPRRGVTTRLQ